MKFLLVNPPVYDFACFDYWMKPLGLLYLSALLKSKGHSVQFIDCMDRHHPILKKTKDKKYGQGNFVGEIVSKPEVLKKYPRNYKSYGISGENLHNLFKQIKTPDIIVLTSSMTYWYPGVKETAMRVKKCFPDIPLVLGGIYATLCSEHARKNIPADYIFPGSDFRELFKLINEEADEFPNWPGPDYSHYRKIPYIVLRTSMGCPRSCSFCGVNQICKNFMVKNTEKIEEEINYLSQKYEVRDFVFYDDSLLENSNFLNYLEGTPKNLNFHTPNGIEVRKIDSNTAKLLRRMNFVDPFLAIESANPMRLKEMGGKLSLEEVKKAVKNLFAAGYHRGEVSAYIILGLPGQELEEIKESIEYVHHLGLKVRLAEYAVVPGTKEASKLDGEILNEPLLHNNSLFPSYPLSKWKEIFKLKEYAKKLNRKL